jgi:RNA polymerase sigma factor (sigma-70 family)
MAAASLIPLWQNVYRMAGEACRPTDRELLQAFVHQGDQAAFEVLVRRHGALVLGVCRRVLGNDADADDAFQAAFLVLAKKAGSTAWQDSVAGWLHRTAHRLACQARAAALRRTRREKRAPVRASANPLEQLSAQELLRILDEELLCLPERYRVPLVLCYLQGRTRDEAAQQLGCPPATLKCWLARGRARLHRAAVRRGLTLGGILGGAVLASGSSSVAAEVVRRTVQSAQAVAAGQPLAGLVSSNVTQLVEGGLHVMILTRSRAILALLLVCGALTGAALSRSATATQNNPAGASPDAKAAAVKTSCQGRVVSPEGKPVPGAKVVFVRHVFNEYGDLGDTPAAHGLTGADGRFQFAVPPPEPGETGEWPDRGMLLAFAPGYGPGWVTVSVPEKAKDATLKLVRDDVPVVGRVVDLDGKPIAGASVRALGLTVTHREDLGAWVKQVRTTKTFYGGMRPNFQLDLAATPLRQTARTDAEGRFRLSGFGRERLVKLRFSGPTIETRDVYAMTRPGGMLVVPRQKDEPQWGSYTIHGATFTHAAAPTRPVIGTVTDRATGKLLAGITVRASLPFVFTRGPNRSLVTKTDENGRYRLVGLPRNAGQGIQVLPEPSLGYLPAGGRTGQAADLEPARLDFKLVRGIVIRGRVTDKATGKPVPARVDYLVFADNPSLNDAPDFRIVSIDTPLTGRDGAFTLVGMLGRGIVVATVSRPLKSGYLVAVGADRIKPRDRDGFVSTYPYVLMPTMVNTLVPLDVARDAGPVTCNVVLDPGKTIRGTIVDPEGKPITGARVRPTWGHASVAQWPLPAAQFTFTAVDVDRPQPFFFWHHEKKLGAVATFKGDKVEGLTVKLQRLGVITGRLLDPDGEPLAGRHLSGYVEDGQLNIRHGWAGFFRVTADKDGRFRAEVIPGVKVGAYFQVSSGRLGDKVFQKLTLEPGQVHDVGDVKVNPRPE